jgi:hypothetical protein
MRGKVKRFACADTGESEEPLGLRIQGLTTLSSQIKIAPQSGRETVCLFYT